MATFYIEAVENTDIALVMVGSPTIGTVNYGVNDSTCPNTYTVTTESTPISLTAGQKCYWTITSTTTDFSTSNYLKFTSTKKINVGGNMSDLIGGESKIPRNYCFNGLFNGCAKLVSASDLIVVDDFNGKTNCYRLMFRSCTSLVAAPELLATTLTNYCYNYMFQDCTSLTVAPTLPATTLADYCYAYMFYGCTSLTIAPALPATTLARNCYQQMFYNCTSLTTPPTLSAITLAVGCYLSMFNGCTNIKLSETQTAPYLIPYRIPSEGTGTEEANSLINMFSNTSGTFAGTPTINTTYYLAPYATFYIEAVEDTDITLSKVGTPTVGNAYYGVNDHGVSNVYNYGDTIHLTAGQKCYWFVTSTTTDFSFSDYLNFTSTAKINVGGNLSDLIGGKSKIPTSHCFSRLFYNCTKLVSASNLIVVNDFNSKGYCYYNMFSYCTSLTTPPELPATTLTSNCYNSMFQGCTSLTIAPTLPATTLANKCYYWMFASCTSLTTPPALPATTLADSCYERMFYNCTNIKLSETQTAPYSILYRIPSEGTGTEGTGSLTSMFTNTSGTFKGTPTINKIYYLAPPSSPISITYKGQELANFETGSKTLKCGGKYMEGDVIIAREIGTNNVVVLYNSATILTFQNGTKTLKCAGKGMATDLVIQTS